MDPVGGVVELPVGVPVALLQRVPRAHAELNRDDVGLAVREAVVRAGEVLRIAIGGEDVAGDVVVGAHAAQRIGIGLEYGPELCVTVRAWRVVDRGDGQIVDHPPLVPAALVVDHEQPGDIGEDVDERPHVVGIGRQVRLRLQDHAHRAEGGETAVGPGGGEHRGVVDSGYRAGERVRLEARRIQQVVLEELARLGLEGRLVEMSLGVRLGRELAVRSPRQLNEPIAERAGQMANVAAVANHGHVHVGRRVRVTRRRRLRPLCLRQGGQGDHAQGQHSGTDYLPLHCSPPVMVRTHRPVAMCGRTSGDRRRSSGPREVVA